MRTVEWAAVYVAATLTPTAKALDDVLWDLALPCLVVGLALVISSVVYWASSSKDGPGGRVALRASLMLLMGLALLANPVGWYIYLVNSVS